MLVLHRVSRALVAGTAGCEVRVRVLDGVTLRVARGDFIVITGGSACERTLFLLCAAGLARVDAGAVIARGGRRYVSDANICAVHSSELLLVDHADGAAAHRAIAHARDLGATILAATSDAAPLERMATRVVSLRHGMLVESHARASAPRARVAERALR